MSGEWWWRWGGRWGWGWGWADCGCCYCSAVCCFATAVVVATAAADVGAAVAVAVAQLVHVDVWERKSRSDEVLLASRSPKSTENCARSSGIDLTRLVWSNVGQLRSSFDSWHAKHCWNALRMQLRPAPPTHTSCYSHRAVQRHT